MTDTDPELPQIKIDGNRAIPQVLFPWKSKWMRLSHLVKILEALPVEQLERAIGLLPVDAIVPIMRRALDSIREDDGIDVVATLNRRAESAEARVRELEAELGALRGPGELERRHL